MSWFPEAVDEEKERLAGIIFDLRREQRHADDGAYRKAYLYRRERAASHDRAHGGSDSGD